MNEHADVKDGELLQAFMQRGDEAAFEAVVNRHASMVLRVCQGILGDPHEAQDAAQAVFLVLAGKASRFAADVTVAPWLHRVAHDVAVDTVRRRQSRRLREEEGAKMMITSPDVQDAHTEEQIRWLHEQIGKLPERYRAPVVLCYLEGQSPEAAARSLGLAPAALRKRLERGRDRLRGRLGRLGWPVSVGALTALLSAEAGAAVLPATFVSATVQAAILAATGNLAAGVGTGVVSAKVAALTKGAANMLFWSSVKTAAVAVTAAVVVAGSGAIVSQEVAAQRKAAEQPAAPARTGTESWAAEVGEMDLMTVTSLTVAQAEALVKWQAQKPKLGLPYGYSAKQQDAALLAAGATPEQIARWHTEMRRLWSCGNWWDFTGVFRYGEEPLYRTRSPEGQRLGNRFGEGLVLPALTTLTPDTAAALAKFNGLIHLPGLKTLKPDAASALANPNFILSGLTALTPELAAALTKIVEDNRGEPPSKKPFSFDESPLDLAGLTALSSEQAVALTKLRRPLDLSGLTNLTPEVAASLAKLDRHLDLSGLKALTPEAAAALAYEHKSETRMPPQLDLSGLTTLTPELAAALMKLNRFLNLSGVTTLSPDVAAALTGKTRGLVCLALDGLTTLTPETATALGEVHSAPHAIHLRGLTTVSPETAAALTWKQCSWGLTNLTPEVAAVLAKRTNGALDLPCLTTLTPEAAAELAKFTNARIRLPGLTHLTPATAAALAKYDFPTGGFLDLPGLTSLTPEAAAALAPFSGVLDLSGLTTLDPEAAAALAKCKAKVSLPNNLKLPKP